MILLADSAGTSVARALSAEDGRFVLRATHAGAHTLRTLRIGFRAASFGPYVVPASGLTNLTLALRDVPVALAGVRVEGSNACLRAREQGSNGVLAVWEEARTALLASVLSRSQEQLTVTTTTYERVMAPRTDRITRQRVSQRSGQSMRPFVSPRSPDEYAEHGYVEQDATGAVYHAPDADVLLSESFASVHCLRLTTDPREDEVGVSFEPIPDDSREKLVDVSGTLWLDRESAALRRLEFSYTGLDPAQLAAGAGGRLEFLRLATGAWVVKEWLVHVPRLEVVRAAGMSRDPSVHVTNSTLGREERRVLEVWTFGGEIARASVGDRLLWRAPDAIVAGQVRGAEGDAGAIGARVLLAGSSYAVTSDSLGRFRLDGVLPGRYEVRLLSRVGAVLDLAPEEAGEVDAKADAIATLELRAPRDGELLVRRCGAGLVSADRGFLAGTALLAAGVPARNANVSAHWQSISGGSGGLVAAEVETAARADSLGRFGLCGVPKARVLSLSAQLDSTGFRTRSAVTARLSFDSLFTVVNLLLEAPRTIALTGDVHDATGHALPATVVEVIGGAETRTDSSGRFTLRVPTPGTYLVRARRIGHMPAVKPLSVGDVPVAPIAFTLFAVTAQLDTVTVRDRATSALADPGGFNRRRAAGLGGTFLDEGEITRRAARETEQLLRTVPNVRVGVGGILSLNRGAITLLGTPCAGAQVFVDGSEMPDNFDINQVPPASIRGVEVYSGVATTPPELRSARQICGTVAIWTR